MNDKTLFWIIGENRLKAERVATGSIRSPSVHGAMTDIFYSPAGATHQTPAGTAN